VRVKFRGREITYPQIALQDLAEIAQELADVAVIEQQPLLEGRTMIMLLAPNPRRVRPAVKKEKADEASAPGASDEPEGGDSE
jgi:translation initiation factor IF-3